MRCEYWDIHTDSPCGGKLIWVETYRQENDMIESFQCQKCGFKTGLVRKPSFSEDLQVISQDFRSNLITILEELGIGMAVEYLNNLLIKHSKKGE